MYAVKIFEDYPLFGTGAGTFYTAFTRYRGHDIGAFFDHAHNDYVQFLAETGAIGIGADGPLRARRARLRGARPVRAAATRSRAASPLAW